MKINNNKNKGCFIVLMGPDGAGKSTVTSSIEDYAKGLSQLFHRFHWRPGLLPKPGKRNKTVDQKISDTATPPLPPEEYTYGTFMSLIRYIYYMIDFIFGYWLIIRPARKAGTLIIGERWYYDVIINPVRYGFRLPRWLLVFGGHLIPSPDMVILLNGNAEAIHARKPELSAREISKQLTAMTSLIGNMKNSYTISTDDSVEDTIQNVHTSISKVIDTL